MLGHATAERRSLRYHAAIAARIAHDPNVVARARARVEGWLREGSVAEPYAAGWKEILDWSSEHICAFLVEQSERGRAFRQVSPFVGVLTPKERWRLWASEMRRR